MYQNKYKIKSKGTDKTTPILLKREQLKENYWVPWQPSMAMRKYNACFLEGISQRCVQKSVTYLTLNSSSVHGNRLNEGSNCGTIEAEGAFEGPLNCCRRDQRSLYSRRSLGYSPSNACFKNVDAREKKMTCLSTF